MTRYSIAEQKKKNLERKKENGYVPTTKKDLKWWQIALIIFGALIVLGTLGNLGEEGTDSDTTQFKSSKEKEVIVSICDGISVTKDCELEGTKYSTYIYHPAVEEKSHMETITTYKKVIVGYCTLCNDGTYSPSCSTGRGTCSHHGGVAQWNAPIYRDEPQYEQRKVIDSPATPERYETVIKE